MDLRAHIELVLSPLVEVHGAPNGHRCMGRFHFGSQSHRQVFSYLCPVRRHWEDDMGIAWPEQQGLLRPLLAEGQAGAFQGPKPKPKSTPLKPLTRLKRWPFFHPESATGKSNRWGARATVTSPEPKTKCLVQRVKTKRSLFSRIRRLV